MGREARQRKPSKGNGKAGGLARPSSPSPKPEHIFVGLPSGDGNYNGYLCQFTDFLLSLNGRQSKWWFSLCRRSGFKPIDHARNKITKEFMDSGASRLWWWDSDVRPYENAMEMLEHQAPVVAGIYPVMRDSDTNLSLDWSAYRRNSTNRFHPVFLESEEPLIVDAAGTGAMLMKREVLEQTAIIPGKKWWTNTYGELGEIDYSDDLEFFTRYTAGVKVLPAIRCGHLKTHDLAVFDMLGRVAFKMGKESAAPKLAEAPRVVLAS